MKRVLFLGNLATHPGNEHIRAVRELRQNPSPAIETLWSTLRNHKSARLRFYRQRVIGRVIVDYYRAAARLVVEVDGDIYDYQQEYDAERTSYLEDCGYQSFDLEMKCIKHFRCGSSGTKSGCTSQNY